MKISFQTCFHGRICTASSNYSCIPMALPSIYAALPSISVADISYTAILWKRDATFLNISASRCLLAAVSTSCGLIQPSNRRTDLDTQTGELWHWPLWPLQRQAPIVSGRPGSYLFTMVAWGWGTGDREEEGEEGKGRKRSRRTRGAERSEEVRQGESTRVDASWCIGWLLSIGES